MSTKPPPPHYRLNRRAALVLGGVFLLLGISAALACFRHLDPERRRAAVRESARQYLERAQWRQAAIQLGNLVQLVPGDKLAWQQLGQAHLQIAREAGSAGDPRRIAAALSCFQRAVELDPEDGAGQRQLLELDLRSGNWSEVRRRRDVFARLAPRDPLVTLAWELPPTEFARDVEEAQQLLSLGQPLAAAERLRPLADRFPADLDVLAVLANALTRLEQVAERRDRLARARRVLGSSARLALVEAELALAQGNAPRALTLARMAAERPHVEVAARHLMAEIYQGMAREHPTCTAAFLVQAANEYRQILQDQPSDMRAVVNLAWLLGVRLGRGHDALAVTTQALAEAKDPDARLLEVHGWLLVHLDQPVDAVTSLLQASQSAPDNPDVRWRLAVAYRKSGRYHDALETLGGLLADPRADHRQVQWLLAESHRQIHLRNIQ